MAHICPDCGATCHCGDIDDIEWDEGSPESDACEHFLTPGCSAFEGEGEDFPEYPDEE